LTSTFESHIKKGDADHYEILAELGKGNFGVVLKAEKSGV
jgi:hypothetical protein